jgi:hypothetical protein
VVPATGSLIITAVWPSASSEGSSVGAHGFAPDVATLWIIGPFRDRWAVLPLQDRWFTEPMDDAWVVGPIVDRWGVGPFDDAWAMRQLVRNG